MNMRRTRFARRPVAAWLVCAATALALLGLTGPVAAYGGTVAWSPQVAGAPYPIRSADFIDASVGYAVGDAGTILKTADGGSTWTPQTSGTLSPLVSVHLFDVDTGWASGGGGAILKTVNGGTTWTPQISNTTDALYGIDFYNATDGWAVGVNGTIVHTADGGTTWAPQTSGTSDFLIAVHSTDADTAWAVGQNGTILKTINGGTNWVPQTSGTSEWLYSVDFTDTDTGWAVGSAGTILKTVNGGTLWTPQTSGTANVLFGICFLDAQTGWAAGSMGTVLGTVNGGATWVPQGLGNTDSLLWVEFVRAHTGWVGGGTFGGGVIFKTPVPVPLYRFYNASNGAHFYTASEAEKQSVLNHHDWPFTYEGPAYHVLDNASADGIPVYRFYNASNGAHFYTASEAEKESVLNHHDWPFTYEGIAYYVLPSAYSDAMPVYRFYNVRNGAHFYTASEAEKENVLNHHDWPFTYEGIAYYVPR